MLAVELKDVCKSFRGKWANDHVTLRVRKGTIHALVGENGAGKSTLMKLLYGLYVPDSGSISVHGKTVAIRHPSDAIALGIGMVHQHFMLIPTMTVTENIVLGSELSSAFGILNLDVAAVAIKQLSRQYELHVDPYALVGSLSVGLLQRVEILKILYRNSDILILDEPTALLTPQEVTQLFATLNELKNLGKTVIIITHKLNEIMMVSDDITVLRSGKVVAESATRTITSDEVARLMVGRDVRPLEHSPRDSTARTIVAIDDLTLESDQQHPILKHVSFTIGSREIVGVAGVEGNGQTALVEVLTGMRRDFRGSVTINGAPIDYQAYPTAHIPEDRQARGLVLSFSAKENLILGRHRETRFSSPRSLNRHRIDEFATSMMTRYDIRPRAIEASADEFSGGNQQKLVIARELDKSTDVIVASQPTRGLDIGAIEFVHSSLLEQRDAGKAILLVSSDLTELLALSDRIIVMFEGEIAATFSAHECNEELLGLYMTGSRRMSA